MGEGGVLAQVDLVAAVLEQLAGEGLDAVAQQEGADAAAHLGGQLAGLV